MSLIERIRWWFIPSGLSYRLERVENKAEALENRAIHEDHPDLMTMKDVVDDMKKHHEDEVSAITEKLEESAMKVAAQDMTIMRLENEVRGLRVKLQKAKVAK